MFFDFLGIKKLLSFAACRHRPTFSRVKVGIQAPHLLTEVRITVRVAAALAAHRAGLRHELHAMGVRCCAPQRAVPGWKRQPGREGRPDAENQRRVRTGWLTCQPKSRPRTARKAPVRPKDHLWGHAGCDTS